MIKHMKIMNSEGQVIKLSNEESRRAQYLETHIQNALGYEVSITTLTTIMKKISEQKFFKIPFANYVPVRIGEGAWSTVLLTYRSFTMGGDFMAGVLNTGSNSSRLASADSGVDAVPVQVNNWAKEITWTIMDLEQASKSGNWDIVSSKEKSRKTNWDLGLQSIAFLGAAGNSAILGLFNQAGISVNTTTITKAIKSMDPDELKAFQEKIVQDYRANSEFTVYPTHFVIPESDYNGLASQASPDFPVKSTLQLLEEAFKVTCQNPNFKILPSAYADASQSGKAYQQYALYNYDEESLRMDIPVDYTNTLANSLNNFSFQNVGYGQFTGVMAYRPKELLYFRYNV